MKSKWASKNILMNSRGLISADFIFSLVLCVGLCVVIFALTFTLSISEVAQYIAFSVARAHASGHVDVQMQKQMGLDKFKELTNNGVLKALFNNPKGSSWFSIGPQPVIKSGYQGENFASEYGVTVSDTSAPLTGVKILFKPKLLNLKIAFLGSTSEDPDAGFSANVTSFIFREPSQAECLEQMKVRNKAILDLSSRYSTLGGATSGKYVALEDNGC